MMMSRICRLCVCLALTLVVVGATTASGQGPIPRTLPAPPWVPDVRPVEPSEVALSQVQDLPPLKAVLIVGPIDGDTGPWTLDEIDNMEATAVELEANGVEVHRFYTPNNDWGQISQAADGAHFLFYRGHGVYWSDFPSPDVGGFALKNDFISSDDIRQDLHLAPNAIVMLYGCFTAGHSSDPSDHRDIGIDEAKRRVDQYSDPFFDVGAAGYYANWFGSAFQMFVRYLFQGETLGEAYESYFDFNPATVHRTMHPDHAQMAMWLDKDYWDGYWQYNNAFAGLPDETLGSLFVPPTLGNLPTEIGFAYSIPEQAFLFDDYQATPLDVGSGGPLTWTVTSEGSWFTAAPGSGTTSGSFWITPTTFSTDTVVTYTGAVTVTVTAPAGVSDSPHRIDLSLQVADTPFSYVCLPLVAKGSAPAP